MISGLKIRSQIAILTSQLLLKFGICTELQSTPSNSRPLKAHLLIDTAVRELQAK